MTRRMVSVRSSWACNIATFGATLIPMGGPTRLSVCTKSSALSPSRLVNTIMMLVRGTAEMRVLPRISRDQSAVSALYLN